MHIIITIICVSAFGYLLKLSTKKADVGKKRMQLKSLTMSAAAPVVAVPTKTTAAVVDYDTPTYQRRGVVIELDAQRAKARANAMLARMAVERATARATTKLANMATEVMDSFHEHEQTQFEVIA
jgi:hypothetical protein